MLDQFRPGRIARERAPADPTPEIQAQQQQLPKILELGLRELHPADQARFDGAADVLELLAAHARKRF
jgi:hypothetical protein